MNMFTSSNQISLKIHLIVFLLAFSQILPAWDILTVYRNDGEDPMMLYTVDIDSLVCSHIGIDSVLYSDWQVQEIWTSDTIYRIPLASIDSIQFKAIDIQKSIDNVVATSSQVSEFFMQSNNIQELANHLDEIQQLDKVEKAWVSGTSLFVKVKDWGNIFFYYPPMSGFVEKDIVGNESDSQGIRKEQASSKNIIGSNNHTPICDNPSEIRICIANQITKDLRSSSVNQIANQMRANFKSCGFNNVDMFEGESVGKKFFGEDLYNYDIILMNTHGAFDGQRHWLTTGCEYEGFDNNNSEAEGNNAIREKILKDIKEKWGSLFSPDCISYGHVKEMRGENHQMVDICYTILSETFFAKSKKLFRGNGKAIFFNSACSSMQGSPSLAKILLNKGLGYYMGYTNINSVGWRACEEFTEKLLNGYDVISAKQSLPSNLLREERITVDNVVLDLPIVSELTGKGIYDLIDDYTCILRPQTLDAASPFDGKLFGEIRQLNPYDLKCSYGFCIGLEKDLKDAEIEDKKTFYYCSYDEITHTVSFDTQLEDFEDYPGTYYYCAFMWDGNHYCFGDIKQFEIKKQNNLKIDLQIKDYYNRSPKKKQATVSATVTGLPEDVSFEKMGFFYGNDKNNLNTFVEGSWIGDNIFEAVVKGNQEVYVKPVIYIDGKIYEGEIGIVEWVLDAYTSFSDQIIIEPRSVTIPFYVSFDGTYDQSDYYNGKVIASLTESNGDGLYNGERREYIVANFNKLSSFEGNAIINDLKYGTTYLCELFIEISGDKLPFSKTKEFTTENIPIYFDFNFEHPLLDRQDNSISIAARYQHGDIEGLDGVVGFFIKHQDDMSDGFGNFVTVGTLSEMPNFDATEIGQELFISLGYVHYKTTINNLTPYTTYYYTGAILVDGDTIRGKTETVKTCILRRSPIDLGLSVKWASCDLGADYPFEVGDLYAWGESSTKEEYTEENYPYRHQEKNDMGGFYTAYDKLGQRVFDYTSNGGYDFYHCEIGNTEYDAAKVIWGQQWRMPSKLEWMELITKCTITRITDKNSGDDESKYGIRVTGPNGNSIFFSFSVFDERYQPYWSSSDVEKGGRSSESYKEAYGWSGSKNDLQRIYKYKGNRIRPVCTYSH